MSTKEQILKEFLKEYFDNKHSHVNISSDVKWAIEELLKTTSLFMKQAKFSVGDRVVISKAPIITETISSGWLGGKHFLIPGAKGAVRSVDFYDGEYRYDILFDDESWFSSYTKKVTLVDENHKHLYSFRGELLERSLPVTGGRAGKTVTQFLRDRLYRHTGD